MALAYLKKTRTMLSTVIVLASVGLCAPTTASACYRYHCLGPYWHHYHYHHYWHPFFGLGRLVTGMAIMASITSMAHYNQPPVVYQPTYQVTSTSTTTHCVRMYDSQGLYYHCTRYVVR